MKEADRLKVIWQVITGKLRIKEATAQLFLSRRQVIRIRNRVKAEAMQELSSEERQAV
jgi:hypothetical protein